jgi:LPXTG-motif cell wall-anchored protein
MVAGATVLAIPNAAYAYAVPFQDQNQSGSLTLCNAAGHSVTSGSLRTVPFVWRAVSSTPAPAHYTRAYLVLYQPIQHEDPADWTGYQMTVQAIFSNPKNPMAAATYADQPLLWPDQQMPPYWDGLYELRMYFSQPLQAGYSATYPAAVIRVTGDKWSLVRGGGGSCNDGTAVSIETQRLPKSETEIPHVLSANGKDLTPVSSATAHTSGASKATTSVPADSTSTASTPSTTDGSRALAFGASPKGGGGGLSAGPIAAIAAGVVAIGASAGLFLRRRRRRSGTSPAPGGLAG